MELKEALTRVLADDMTRMIISRQTTRKEKYKKIEIEKKASGYQASCFTDTQVFHRNLQREELNAVCCELICGHFRQVNAWGKSGEHILLISKSGDTNYKCRRVLDSGVADLKRQSTGEQHNRQKNYLIPEGTVIPALVDMGVFTKDGKVVRTMYDKFRQINRFLELIRDEVAGGKYKHLNIIDFGCGKSYLTFVVYYYLTEVLKLDVNMVGLDLKEDVIAKCNAAAEKYRYEKLHFYVGDVNGYEAPFAVDMVITLHACDTATDYALAGAVKWNAKLIFSVPCCQHELKAQIKTEHFEALTDYGIIKERFSALATDAIRGKLLEASGYKTQLLEFVDFDHTPKNILIRAVKRSIVPESVRKTAMTEVEALMEEFHFEPTLYNLLRIQ